MRTLLKYKWVMLFFLMNIMASIYFLKNGYSEEIIPIADVSEINFSVTAISAGYNGNEIDPDIQIIADEISSLFRFSSFKKIKSYSVLLKKGASDRIILPGDNQLIVAFKEVKSDGVLLNVSMGKVLKTEFSLGSGSHILIGGPAYGDGNIILLMKAEY